MEGNTMAPISASDCQDPLLQARPAFEAGLGESFARHIRALERMLIDARTDVRRISVVEAPGLPSGFARMTMREQRYQARAWIPESEEWDSTERPVTVREIFILYGANGKTPAGATRPVGDTEEAEWHHRARGRLAIAHELAHLALGHCFHPRPTNDATALQPELRLKENLTPEDEWSAYAYAVALLKLSSDYIDARGRLLVVTQEQTERELKTIWERVFWHEPLSRAYTEHLFSQPLFGPTSLNPDA